MSPGFTLKLENGGGFHSLCWDSPPSSDTPMSPSSKNKE